MNVNPEWFLNAEKNKIEKDFYKAFKIGVDFLKSKNIKNPVIDYLEQKKIWENLYEKIPTRGKKIEFVIKKFKEKILKNSINFSNPNYLGFPDIGSSSAALLGHILSGFLNQNMINSETASPTATFVEITIIQWLRKLLGYHVEDPLKSSDDIGGIATVGGVMSNSVGILLAREVAKKSYKTNDTSKFRIFVPEGIDHYSIRRSAFWLGFPKESIIKVKIGNGFCLDTRDLEKKIKRERSLGKIPMAVVAYAGDSRTMSIDNFKLLEKICKKKRVWLHIDACHGFSLSFSKKLRIKIKDINLADSITLDPHKVLFIPYNLSYLLVKRPRDFRFISEKADICTKEPFSLGAMTPFIGSFAFNSLKLWFLIENMGVKNIGRLIEQRHTLMKWFEKQIDKQKEFIRLNDVVINSCAFFYFPKKYRKEIVDEDIKRYNIINKKIYRALFKKGKFYVHSFPLIDAGNKISKKDKYKVDCLRIMIGNPLTSKDNLRSVIKEIKKIGAYLEKNEKSNN